jgi:hypothetical protein
MPQLDGQTAMPEVAPLPQGSGRAQDSSDRDFFASIIQGAQTPHTQRPGAYERPAARKPPKSAKFDWKRWSLGGKVLFIAACVAAASMLLPWVDVGIASANGISQGAFLFLAVFIYPLWMLLTNRSIHRVGGIACGAIGILLAIVYIVSKEVAVFGYSVNAASGGPYVFLLACVALIFGVVKYSAIADSTSSLSVPSPPPLLPSAPVVPGSPTAGNADAANQFADQLAKLKAAWESGVLTEEEFQRKKAEILSRL